MRISAVFVGALALTACGATGGSGGGSLAADAHVDTDALADADVGDAATAETANDAAEVQTADVPDSSDSADSDAGFETASDVVNVGKNCPKGGSGGEPCDDGNSCTQGDYCLLGQCVGYPISGCCNPSCTGKLCGPDGCGGSCGGCGTGQTCDNTGTCVSTGKTGDTCSAPTIITSLPFKTSASTTGLSDDYQAEDLTCAATGLGFYAPDAVYRYSPQKDGFLTISVTGTDFPATVYAVTNCSDINKSCLGGVVPYPSVIDLLPLYVEVKKGVEVFIIVDGDAKSGAYTLEVSDCIPDCVGQECGWSGCGKNCGECPMGITWNCSDQGKCVCAPSCADKMCGDDGCGSTCGSCDFGMNCDGSGQCVSTKAGDTCGTAISVSSFPFEFDGDTAGFGNDSYAWWACSGNGTGAYLGDQAPDMMFSVKPATTTTYYGLLTGSGNQSAFYARTDCSDPVNCLQAGYKGFTLLDQLFVEAVGGKETFFVVDSYSTGSLKFHLHLEACAKDTTCAQGEPGEYCSVAIPLIGSLPISVSHTVGGALDSYTLPQGACGSTTAIGKGGQDLAYSFTAPSTGTFTVGVTGKDGMDPALYVVSDCTQLASSCLAFSAKTTANGSESVQFSAQAGQIVYFVIDNETTVSGSFLLSVK